MAARHSIVLLPWLALGPAPGLAVAEPAADLGAGDHGHAPGGGHHHHQRPGGAGPLVQPHRHGDAARPLDVNLTLGVDSRYVVEGRDALPGEGGIVYTNLVKHWHTDSGSCFAELLGAAGWEADYEEWNVAAGYEWEAGGLAFALAGTWLWFPEDGQDDVEAGISAEWIHDSGFGIAGEAYWSFEAEGWFGEAGVFYECPLCDGVTVVPSLVLGVNQGFVADEHDGFNHVGAQLEGIWAVSEVLELTVYGACVAPLDEEAGESLRDLCWAGGSLVWSF
ncbi:MAG: hypothetical protein HKN82_20460 [Akkermansiaceae bacterium]|nr:hypothetical protein [Akkermansiaceae bacterium]